MPHREANNTHSIAKKTMGPPSPTLLRAFILVYWTKAVGALLSKPKKHIHNHTHTIHRFNIAHLGCTKNEPKRSFIPSDCLVEQGCHGEECNAEKQNNSIRKWLECAFHQANTIECPTIHLRLAPWRRSHVTKEIRTNIGIKSEFTWWNHDSDGLYGPHCVDLRIMRNKNIYARNVNVNELRTACICSQTIRQCYVETKKVGLKKQNGVICDLRLDSNSDRKEFFVLHNMVLLLKQIKHLPTEGQQIGNRISRNYFLMQPLTADLVFYPLSQLLLLHFDCE